MSKVTTKVSDITLNDFVQAVRNKTSERAKAQKDGKGIDLCQQAEDAKVDIVSIIKRVKEGVVAEFGVLTGVTKAISAIRTDLELALAKDVECYYLGMNDRPGTAVPISMLLLRFTEGGKKAILFEATTFDPMLEKADKTKVKLSAGMGKVILKLKENVKYNSFEVVQLVKYEPISSEEMAPILAGIVNDPRKFGADDKYVPIALLGSIRGTYPVSILKKNEDEQWKEVGKYPALVPNQIEDEPELTPVLKIDMEPMHGIKVRVTLGPRKYSVPILDVQDMPECIRVAVRDIKDPKDQAQAISEIVENRDIIVLGLVTKVSTGKGDVIYMDVSAHSIIDAPDKMDWFSTGETKAAAAPPAAAPVAEKPAEKETKSKKGDKGKAKEEKPAETAPAETSGPKSAIKFNEVCDAIKDYCGKLGMKYTQLTPEIVKEQICPSAKMGTIEAALEELKE